MANRIVKFNELYVGPKDRRLLIQKTMDRVYQRNIEKEKVPSQLRTLLSERQPRRLDQKTDQDWKSVWPAAQTYRHSVVPLPIRMGYSKNWLKKRQPQSYGNLELLKVPNFLHLTPKHIQAHCDAIKKFCTKFPDELKQKNLEKSATAGIQPWHHYFPIKFVYTDFVHQGTNIRDERARAVTMRVKLNALDLDTHSHNKFLQLVEERYNPDDDFVTIHSARCPTRKQNRDFCMYVLTALYHESKKFAPWEATYVQELLAVKEAERRKYAHSDLESYEESDQQLADEAEEERSAAMKEKGRVGKWARKRMVKIERKKVEKL